MPDKFHKSEVEPLIPILKTNVIPWWERCALDHLAVTQPTLKEFKQEELPELMRVSVRKRLGAKTSLRGTRNFNNVNSYRGIWPKDDQAIYNYPALVFILTGQADFHIADYVVHCPQNHFLLFSDNVPRPIGIRSHLDGENIDQKQCDVLWFFVPPGANSAIAYVCHSQGKKHWGDEYRIVNRKEVIDSFQFFVREMQEKEEGYQQIARSVFHSFLHLFLRELKAERFLGGQNNVTHTSPHVLKSSPIEEAKQYVRTHLGQHLTTANVAQHSYMSRSSFIERFHHETGETFHDFVIKERMEVAKQLLEEGGWSINSICRFVGLKPTQLRAQFKKYFETTPSQFRREQKNGQNR